MIKRLQMTGMVAVLLAAFVVSAEAGPITGTFAFKGHLLPVGGDGSVNGPGSLNPTTGIDFIDLLGIGGPTPGVDGTFQVSSGTGNFSSFVGALGTIKDFSFAQPAAFPMAPLSAFQVVGGVTFDLLTVTVTNQTPYWLSLQGTGIFHRAVFDDTWGSFALKTHWDDNSFEFSARDTIPEPASLLLIGAGLIIGGSLLRRRHLSTRSV